MASGAARRRRTEADRGVGMHEADGACAGCDRGRERHCLDHCCPLRPGVAGDVGVEPGVHREAPCAGAGVFGRVLDALEQLLFVVTAFHQYGEQQGLFEHVRALELPRDLGEAIHPAQLAKFAREGAVAPLTLLNDFGERRRVASLADAEG